jgi:hypothetical protein
MQKEEKKREIERILVASVSGDEIQNLSSEYPD